MSLLKNLFSKKSSDGESSGDLSLGSVDLAGGTTIDAQRSGLMALTPDSVDDPESVDPLPQQQAELVAIPLLGRRSIVAHQRILF